ncbi:MULTISPECIES: DEAD/DEAH box helicase [Halomonadaceae]|uniref:DEAD/DEAH box helicase n=1 Tax=Halomonadaceae TaxID=28256 RepID=UPI0012F3E88C|nr:MULTISPECIES: DEAD/DEAH box helicase family protein [Halomonas]CAD5248371.1 Helicase [Halomonas sp. 59]CAD5248485.1 Helicase [Halomonas sp. 113]CAD5251860.1 Helicase [Halomonas sp. 156]CAD5256931.1 Helicase [Halomonas sp. I3]VXC00291.1 Helicase [Halomonas titanicae]
MVEDYSVNNEEEIILNKKSSQESFKFPRQGILEFQKPLYYRYERFDVGVLSQLALEAGSWSFSIIHERDSIYKVTHETGVSFFAELQEGAGKNKGTYQIKGCVKNVNEHVDSYFYDVKINGVGMSGWTLRPAQIGAIYSLLSHWSLTKDVATVVLPTGSGKTETMLVATLADQAKRTLVIVPTIDLKNQIAEKFSTWGILRKLGVIPSDATNPSVLILNKTVLNIDSISKLESADVVVSTPGLLARSKSGVKKKMEGLFSHVYFDEAHHVKAAEWDSIKNLFKDAKIVQFTATPYRNDRKPIEGKVVYNYPLSKALKDKCFSKISLVAVDERHPRKKDKAIAEAAIGRLMEDRNKGLNRHRLMVRAVDKNHAEELYSKYSGWFPDERIVLVHSSTKGRRKIVEDIKNGKYDIVICVDMLKEGFDYPDFKIAAVHGVHKSLAVLLQFIGRFTRTQEGLGDASFVVNYAEEKISIELENLFQEGSGWEEVISEIADAKKEEAETLLSFLQGCKPYSGFDSPEIELNPKLVYPALSCVCFHSDKVDWSFFKSAFNLRKYALSQPFLNAEENVFYFTTQKREKVKWARTDAMRDQTWDLIVMHHDSSSKILYVGYSEKRLDVATLVEKITGEKASQINGDCVFRSFDSIKRLSIIHAGIFKPANHLHRYSRLSGADVTTELTKWKEGKRCQKSDFVGVGFRDGFPVSVGASVKGKVWSPARVGDLKEWKSWCLDIGRMITDNSIDANQILEDSAEKIQIENYPDDLIVLATDWSEELYERIHKLTIERPNSQSLMLSECALSHNSCVGNRAEFTLRLFDEVVTFSIVLGGEKGHSIHGLDDCNIIIEGLKSSAIPLRQFFEENPPTMFLLNGCTISGCIHTDYGEAFIQQIPSERIEALGWEKVNYKIESLYKGNSKRDNSIQEYMMKRLAEQGAKVVFNDDNSGESADIVAIFVDNELVRFEMIHCKYSKEKSGSRISDLYEVCGQAIVSLRYKWKPEELLKHMERRNGAGILKDKRFYHGGVVDIEEIRKALRYTNVKFEFAIAQPGVEASGISLDMRNFLGSVYSTIVEMTETQLKCYFNK